MALDGCGTFVKYCIFLVNFLIFVGGIAVFALGIWALTDQSEAHKLVGNDPDTRSLTVGAAILIGFGLLVAIIAFLGCCGAIKEVKCMLMTFFLINLLIAVAVIVGVVYVYVCRADIEKSLTDVLLKSLDDTAVKDAWDDIQKQFSCCGVNNYSDWMKHHGSVPTSCNCNTTEGTYCHSFPEGTYWNEGCKEMLYDEFTSKIKILGGVGIGTCLVIFLAMVFSIVLYCKL